jgi:MFS family permease
VSNVRPRLHRELALLFAVMLVIGAGNTALQSIMPAIGRTLGIADTLIALAFSVSALIWMIAAPYWAARSEATGRKAMVMLGIGGFSVSMLLCGLILTAGVQGVTMPLATLVAFIAARTIYGCFGAAAPPAAQAIVAGQTSRADRTKALTLLSSAFGLGTILGPALAPFFVLPVVGLAGPAYAFAVVSLIVSVIVVRLLPDDQPSAAPTRGAATSYPSIGGLLTGASITVATAERSTTTIALTEHRIWPWMLIGLVMGHAQAMTSQAIGFLVIDRLALDPILSQQSIAIVLMTGASAALVVQWSLIPLLGWGPRRLVLIGLILAGLGCLLIVATDSLYGLATAFGLSSAGFGFIRPGYTAGSSLAVGPELQAAVAGRVTSVNGAVFVLGPWIGVALYQIWRPTPYLLAAALCLMLALYMHNRLPRDS